ncbi:unnamed protein product [Clonostachys rosea]|uniref:Uncharacterized protein n=1 Tax=Bionectria ochroleuca TaxID=29856 RepID=A0ABY6UXD1_BIOOC|nr:unnamed protein product [Clonostachys rosea]
MCKKANCDTCNTDRWTTEKATWWGCGAHVPMVMDNIPDEERCICDPKIEKGGKEYPPMAKSPS